MNPSAVIILPVSMTNIIRGIKMIQIRKGVFETNSSSSHSIVMMKTDKPKKCPFESAWVFKGEVAFYESDLEFGRAPFDLLTDWYGRVRYCIAAGYDVDELTEMCRRNIKGFDHFNFEKNRWSKGPYKGYIDHQSIGALETALKKFNVSLEEFIFNDRFIIVIDGDEYCVFDSLRNSEMFNKDGVEQIVPCPDDEDDDDYNDEDEDEEEE